jgi:hypothetical protein
VYCLSFSQTLVVFIIHLSGTFFRTQPAGNTLVNIYVAGVLDNRDFKIALFPFNSLDIGKGYQLYVNVPADLDQFGRDNSHGAVVGREGLVQLGHNPTDGGGSLNEIYVKAGVGQIQGALHPRNPSAEHQHRSNHGFIHHHLK